MTDNVLNLAHIHKSSLKKFIYASSSEIYGEPSILPTPESEKISLNIFADRDSYAASKVYGEFAVRLFCKENNMPYTILRPFNTYGSRMDNSKYGQVVPEFIRKLKDKNFTIIGDGDQTRSFCHVKDHVILVEKIMNSSKSINKIINIGNDKEITINHLAKTLHEISKKEFIPSYLPSRKYDVHRRCPNIDLLTSVTGKRPTVTLKQGLSELLASI
jgi:nucleoside-diphosphate-sugar epimerase